MKKIIIVILILAVAYFLVKASNKQVEAPVTTPPPSSNAIKSSGAATAALAAELKISPASIATVSTVAMDWSDSCLGLGGPEEICATVITPGYQVTLNAGGKTYIYRTDVDGTVVRKQP